MGEAARLVESGAFEKLVAELESDIAADGAKKMAEAVPQEQNTGGSDNGSK